MRRLVLFVICVGFATPLIAAFSGTDLFLGSVGRGPGAGGSDWYTTVWIHNPGTAPASVVASLLLRNQANPSPATQTLVVQPGETRRIDNIVETLFGQTSAFGALRLTSAARVVVNGRIYSKPLGTADNESAGQSFDGIPSTFAIASGQSTTLLGAHQTDPLGNSQFRYNYGYVETAGGSGVVRVAAADSTGLPLGTKDYSVGPYEARQFGIVDLVPAVNSTNLRLTVSVVSGSAKVIAFGSGIANHSNDPTTFDMSFRDELLAGPAAPTAVTHDATLTGDGSAGAPLSVANLGVGSTKLNSTGTTPGNLMAAGTGGAVNWVTPSAVLDAALPFRTSTRPATDGPVLDILNSATTGANYAITGTGNGGTTGIGGFTASGTGVLGKASTSGDGVTAVSVSGIAVRATSTTGIGVFAVSDTHEGVNAGSTSSFGVLGVSNSNTGVRGASLTAEGVKGISINQHGVWGEANANDGYGVVAVNTVGNHPALLGTLGFAGDFVGDVRVKGNLSKFGGSFTIDHPLDPEHKTLSHSFVESPDMKNVYDGVIVTDRDGAAEVALPEWFEALNRDFRYQLTVIGRFAQAIIDTEIANNRFTIRTDRPNVKVSWQVTGIRRDPWAEAHRIIVEREKPPDEQGYYLAPELYGQPQEKDLFWAKHPELIRK